MKKRLIKERCKGINTNGTKCKRPKLIGEYCSKHHNLMCQQRRGKKLNLQAGYMAERHDFVKRMKAKYGKDCMIHIEKRIEQ